eukprot:7843930-Lingulodinium_polyedra.AAC.1
MESAIAQAAPLLVEAAGAFPNTPGKESLAERTIRATRASNAAARADPTPIATPQRHAPASSP